MPTLTMIDCSNFNAAGIASRASGVMAAVRQRCLSRGIGEMERIQCENVARDKFNEGASAAVAIAEGIRVAEKFANRPRAHAWRGGPEEPRPAA